MARGSARGYDEMIEVALDIAEERDKLLDRIRDLLAANNNTEALQLMRQYCGICEDEKSNRTSARLN